MNRPTIPTAMASTDRCTCSGITSVLRIVTLVRSDRIGSAHESENSRRPQHRGPVFRAQDERYLRLTTASDLAEKSLCAGKARSSVRGGRHAPFSVEPNCRYLRREGGCLPDPPCGRAHGTSARKAPYNEKLSFRLPCLPSNIWARPPFRTSPGAGLQPSLQEVRTEEAFGRWIMNLRSTSTPCSSIGPSGFESPSPSRG